MGIRRTGEGVSRRAILGGAAAAAAWASIPAASEAQQKRKKLGPNDRVNIAAIGCGGKGAGNMQALLSQNIVALADVDFDKVGRDMIDRKTGQLGKGKVELKAAYDKAARFTDYRKMLD